MKFLVLLAMTLSLFSCNENDKKLEGPFKYYEYRSTTMREYPREYYRLERTEDGSLTLTWAKSSSPEAVLAVPDEAAEQVKSLIEEYKLYKLKSSYRPPFDVRDGIMWHVYFSVGETHISCSADNAWPPEKLREGIEAVNACLSNWIEKAAEK